MVPGDPTETLELFQHDRVALGYASARPYLHPEAFAGVREVVRPAGPFRRALDVGCGTGLASLALLDLAEEVVGVDAALDMLRHVRREDGIRYGDTGRSPEVPAEVRAWLEGELAPLFGREPRRVAFGGYIQALWRF